MPATDIYTTTDMSAAEIQALINSAAPGATIHLEAGTYKFSETLVIDRSDISLVGAGAEKTVIYAAKSMEDVPVIQVGHDVFEPEIIDIFKLSKAASAGSTKITLEAGHDISVGDYIYITQENTDEFFKEIGDEKWQKDSALRTVLVEVTSVSGNTVTFDDELPFDFDPDITTVEHRTILEDNTLSGFTVAGSWGDTDPSKFSNTLGTANGATAILVAGTSGAVIEDVAVMDAASHGITVANSTGFEMSDVIIDGAHDKGAGGNGYGVWIRDVYNSSFTDLSITDTRHAVVFASYTSAVGNTVDVTSTNRDINFHGGLDQDNTVTVGDSIRSGNEISYMSPSVFFNEGTSYGAPTDKSTNDVTFEKVVGTVRADEVTASDKGATISLMGAADIAHTGAGNDIVDMGTGTDTVYASDGIDTFDGGKGTDQVVFELPEESYAIAWDGDTLIVSNGDNVTKLTNFEVVVFADTIYEFGDVQERSAPAQPAQPKWTETGGDDSFEQVDGGSGWQRETVIGSATMGEYLEGLLMIGKSNAAAIGNKSNNSILGNIGDNLIEGGAGNDRIFARAGDDVVFGGDDDDFLHGQSGDDVLIGGAGKNTLVGGVGADTFVAAGGISTIIDFDASKGDKLQFNADTGASFSAAFSNYQMTGKDADGFQFTYADGDLTISYGDEGTLILLDTTVNDLFV